MSINIYFIIIKILLNKINLKIQRLKDLKLNIMISWNKKNILNP